MSSTPFKKVQNLTSFPNKTLDAEACLEPKPTLIIMSLQINKEIWALMQIQNLTHTTIREEATA